MMILWLCNKKPNWYTKVWCLLTGRYQILTGRVVVKDMTEKLKEYEEKYREENKK